MNSLVLKQTSNPEEFSLMLDGFELQGVKGYELKSNSENLGLVNINIELVAKVEKIDIEL